MVNVFALYNPALNFLMKQAGVGRQLVEIEPGTVMNFWVPIEKPNKSRRNRGKHAVVFLHGFAADGITTWQFQVLALAKHYAVYVADLLFFGNSVTDKQERSPEFQANCVAKGLRKLGLEKCTLVGLSYGGMVGFKMAEMYPNLVHSMVVTCSVMALTEAVSRAALQRIGFKSWPDFLLPDSVNGVKVLLEVGFHKLPRLPYCLFKDYLEVMFDHRKEREELLEALLLSGRDFTIPQYPQRIHLLWGRNDKIFDMDTANNLKRQLGERASLDSIENAGHLVQLERPCVYNRCLRSILASFSEEEHCKL